MSERPIVAFTPAALQRLADPQRATTDADSWAVQVGIAVRTTDRTATTVSRIGVTPDFVASVEGEADGLAVVSQQYPAERHVLVGTKDSDRRAAEALDWKYLDVETAAAKAGWALAEEDDRWRASANRDG